MISLDEVINTDFFLSDDCQKEIIAGIHIAEKVEFGYGIRTLDNGNKVFSINNVPHTGNIIYLTNTSLNYNDPEYYSQRGFQKNYSSHPNQKHFPKLMRFISDLPFEQVGRMVIIQSYANTTIPIHNDLGFVIDECGTIHRHRDQINNNSEFLWLRPNSNKVLFSYDPLTQLKTEVYGNVAFFDDMKFHGGYSISDTYSIRVDGVFTEKLRKSIDSFIK